MEDTQWNRILVEKGILEAPKNWSSSEYENKLENESESSENKLKAYAEDDFDEADEAVFREIRAKRLQELKTTMNKKYFGEVYEITRQDYVKEVNEAGDNVFVVLHVYKPGIPVCSLINEHLKQFAIKFRNTKFVKSISSLCIPNFPDENFPAIFVYRGGELKKQYIGLSAFGSSDIKFEDLEWILAKSGAVETELESDPRIARQKSKVFLGFDS